MIETKRPPTRAGLATPKAKRKVTPPKKAPTQKAPPITKDKNTITVKVGTAGFDASMTDSQKLAVLVTQSSMSVITLQQYGGAGDTLLLADLMVEMHKHADAVVSGDLTLIERMLVSQAITLDAMFHNLVQRSHRQESFKGIEVLMRLGLKAQSQARSTAEALALLKNPMPYIRQANIANGPQQVNNGANPEQYTQAPARAGDSQTAPNKLLEVNHGQRVDIGAAQAPSRVNQAVGTVGKVHRA
jgi:hypothetical protein